jgi:error-prone DNA polymerase
VAETGLALPAIGRFRVDQGRNGVQMNTMILHLDADAFFASVEQAADARLRGKPVAVGGSTRGVVASASYEARRYGVGAAMPVAKARRLCPHLVVVPGHYEQYEHFSRMMFSYARDFTPLVEVGSIDEGYADLTGSRGRSPRDIAKEIRRAVRQSLRITLSEGLASNKLVAQVAGKSKKPDALVEVPAGGERDFLAPLDCHWLPGVGPQMAGMLRRAGLPRIGDVAAAHPGDLALFAGKAARELWEFAQGIDERPVVAEAGLAKSYSAQETFERDVTDEEWVEATLRAMADRLFAKVRAEGQAVRTLTVRLRYNDFEEAQRSVSLDEPVDLETSIYGVLGGLLRKAWERRVSLRLAGLRLSNLHRAVWCGSLSLLEARSDPAVLRRVAEAVDELRGRYGARAILRGHDLRLAEEPAERMKQPAIARPRPVSMPRVAAVRTCYAFLDSLLTPARAVELAVQAGCEGIAVCDPNLHGAVPFFQAARAFGIKAVLGAEVRVDGVPRKLFVQNQLGYRNLCRLLSDPAPGRDFWEAHREGLIEAKVPLLRCASPGDRGMLHVLRCIRDRTLAARTPPACRMDSLAWGDEIPMGQGSHNPPWADGDFNLAFEGLLFPAFDPPEACSPREFLARLARQGLAQRYGERASHHAAQLETELGMISRVGYEEYFLSVWALLQKCQRAGIEWITRGSAADSMVCYCLGISNVCPVRFELYFQRFLNPERMALHKLPDIDLDFAHDRRDEVVELLFGMHPPGHVAAVGGFHTFQARAALADAGKALGLPERVVRRMTEHFPGQSGAGDLEKTARGAPAWREGLFDEEPARTALELACRLDGLPRHAKMHPCGMVVCRRPVLDLTPVFPSAKGWLTTHFDMEAVEEAGLVKLDLLAQGGLAVLRDTRKNLAARGCLVPVGYNGPWNAPEVWDMIANGEARGVHHIESPAMTTLAKMCGCRDIDTLVAIVSVIRPGAANALRKASFSRRAMGLEVPSYPHPSLEPVLRTTHGVVAYEEHILQIAEVFAGMPPGRADILRRALVKMRDAEVATLKDEFAQQALFKGRTPGEIEAVWSLVAGFRGYAFCRAHSTAYALEAWQAAWMKKHHPAEFLAAVLTHGKGFYPRLLYTLEARRLGIGLLPPDVNTASPGSYIAETPAWIRVPLSAIKDLGANVPRIIATERQHGPYHSLDDLVRRTRIAPHDLDLLLRGGALDGLVDSRTAGVWRVRQLAAQGPALWNGNAPTAFREAPPLQQLHDEMEAFGFTISAHPLDLWPDIRWETYCPVATMGSFLKQRVTLCGIVVADRTHHQSDGRLMKFLTLCDRSGLVETELFARAYQRFGFETLRFPVLEVHGRVEPLECGRGHTLRIESVRRPRGLEAH